MKFHQDGDQEGSEGRPRRRAQGQKGQEGQERGWQAGEADREQGQERGSEAEGKETGNYNKITRV